MGYANLEGLVYEVREQRGVQESFYKMKGTADETASEFDAGFGIGTRSVDAHAKVRL